MWHDHFRDEAQRQFLKLDLGQITNNCHFEYESEFEVHDLSKI